MGSAIDPTAMSSIPSPLRSPIEEAEWPNLTLSARVGPPLVPEAIFTLEDTVPSLFINRTYTAPRSEPPVGSAIDPTAMSSIPSPLRSPIEEAEWPNLTLSARVGPPLVPEAIFTLEDTVPSPESRDHLVSLKSLQLEPLRSQIRSARRVPSSLVMPPSTNNENG